MHDSVNSPKHYTRGPVEVIEIIEGFELGYRLGNVVKYVLRAGHKGDRLEDLKKARWYLDREIQQCEESLSTANPTAHNAVRLSENSNRTTYSSIQ